MNKAFLEDKILKNVLIIQKIISKSEKELLKIYKKLLTNVENSVIINT